MTVYCGNIPVYSCKFEKWLYTHNMPTIAGVWHKLVTGSSSKKFKYGRGGE